jgi:serine/threonine protein kinase
MALRTFEADQWNMCMTGDKAPKFRDNFITMVEIGKGSFGQVYRAIIKTVEGNEGLVIKEAYLKAEEKRVLKKVTKQNQRWEEVEKNSYPRENKILDLVNQLLLSRRCPNFVYIYNMAMCDGCRVERLHSRGKPLGSCYVTFMEAARTDLYRSRLTNFEAQLSVLYQLLIAVHAIHRYYAIWHRDIKTSNVFVDNTVKPGGYFEYVIGDKTYYVKNTGVVAYLADFGVAEVLNPLHSFTNFFGTRNAEVMRSFQEVAGSYLYCKPISLKNNHYRDWRDTTTGSIVKGTYNPITDHEIFSSIPIDLNNSQKFPPVEFFDDIQDVIRMFVGGKQAQQGGYHTRMQLLSAELEELIKDKQAYADGRSSIYQIHGTVKYLLADEMLDQLYIKPKSVDKVVDRFVM